MCNGLIMNRRAMFKRRRQLFQKNWIRRKKLHLSRVEFLHIGIKHKSRLPTTSRSLGRVVKVPRLNSFSSLFNDIILFILLALIII